MNPLPCTPESLFIIRESSTMDMTFIEGTDGRGGELAGTSGHVFGTTDYHAKFYANQLSRRFTGDTPDKLASSLVDAIVDLNPHQIDAGLFAFQSPLSYAV